MPGRGRPRPRRPRARSRPRAASPPPPPRCCVPACPAPPGRRLHPLPRSLGLRQRWVQAIVGRRPEGERRRCSLQLQRIRSPFICSAHFKPGEVVTAETLPSVFAPDPSEAPPESAAGGAGGGGGGGGSGGRGEGAGPAGEGDGSQQPAEGVQGRIGDLVLAAELMEMVNETVKHVQKEARFEQAFGHDHGAYVVPDDTATLKKMVKEMKDTIYVQNGRLAALQQELAEVLAQYKELKEGYEKERWGLSLELGSKVSELQRQNASLRCEREELQRRLRKALEQVKSTAGTVLFLSQQMKEREDKERWGLSLELGSKVSELQRQNASLRCEREELQRRLQKAQEQADSTAGTVLFLSQQMKEREDKVKEAAFSVDNMMPGRKWLRFYTGFESFERFNDFLRFVTQDAELCSGKIRGDISRGQAEGWTHSTLSHADQLLLVMSRLRLGLLLQDLAYRFKISETTVSRVWLNWTDVIQARLMQVPVVCSPKYLDAFEPKRIVQHRGAPLTVLECTDLFFEGQTKDRPRLGTAQPYRNHYVRRGYALASPSGYMTFASSLAFGIRARSNESGLLEEEGEAEEEAEEEDEEDEGRSGLRLPDFLQGGSPSEEQRGLSREVLSVRSHVDKVLNYRFLKCVYPRTMEAQVDRAWTICCYLACLLHEPMGLR